MVKSLKLLVLKTYLLFILAQETTIYTRLSNFQKKQCPEHVIWGERENEMYGSSVGIWYDMMIVGAYGDQSRGVNTGAVYVYLKVDERHEDWERLAILHPEDGKSNDQYGNSVSLDYDTIVIGAHKADIYGEDSGAAYLYHRKYKKDLHSEIQFVMKLLPENGSTQDYFGSSVTVYGNITVVGAWGCDAAGTLGGCAYVWTKYYGDNDEGEWLYTQQLFPTDSYQRFGTSVATYQNFVVIGAPGALDSNGHEVGAVYVYQYGYDDSQYIGFSWKQIMKIMPSDGLHYDLFGYSVSLWEKTLLIGSPQNSNLPSASNSYRTLSQTGAVYSYVYTLNRKWEFIEKIVPKNMVENGHFGFSVDIYDDIAAVGSYNQAGKGSVSIYREEVNADTGLHENWMLNAVRHPQNEIPGDYFGYTVSIYNAYLAVGAHGASLAWEDPYASPEKEVFNSGGVYLYFGQYTSTAPDKPPTSSIILLGGGSIALIAVGLIAIILIYLEFRGKLDLKIEGTEYQLTDLESSHRSMSDVAGYALSYFTQKEQSISSSSGPVTRNPTQLSPFLPTPSSNSRNRVIDSIDSSSSSMASVSSHSVDTIRPSNSSTYGPSQQALDDSIRMGVTRNKECLGVHQ